MPTTPTSGETALGVDEQFLELIYGDPDLLAAEFASIITAAWPQEPADMSGGAAAGDGPAGHPADATAGPVRRVRDPAVRAVARQRSPPTDKYHRTTEKAGDRHT